MSPSIPSGVARRKGAILGGLSFLTVVYGVVYFILRDSVRQFQIVVVVAFSV